MSDEIQNALCVGLPVVGLESNVISHGLPYPENVRLYHECDQAVRSRGAIPAIIFIDDGVIRIGCDERTLQRLVGPELTQKVTTRDIASCLQSRALGATSVSASIAICELVGIRIFATAGLGGVHRDYSSTMDMSGDLYEISRRKVAVVSAGVKKFLDVKKTTEVLETLNVPVVGYGTDRFPAFYCKDGGVALATSSRSWEEIAGYAQIHLDSNIGGGFLVTVAPSDQIALNDVFVEDAVSGALAEAADRGIAGKDITKHVMRSIDERTDMKSRKANYSVMVEVVSHAADFAHHWSASPNFVQADLPKGNADVRN